MLLNSNHPNMRDAVLSFSHADKSSNTKNEISMSRTRFNLISSRIRCIDWHSDVVGHKPKSHCVGHFHHRVIFCHVNCHIVNRPRTILLSQAFLHQICPMHAAALVDSSLAFELPKYFFIAHAEETTWKHVDSFRR